MGHTEQRGSPPGWLGHAWPGVDVLCPGHHIVDVYAILLCHPPGLADLLGREVHPSKVRSVGIKAARQYASTGAEIQNMLSTGTQTQV